MNEEFREDAILQEVKSEGSGPFTGGSLTVSQFQIGIVMQDGKVVDIFSEDKKKLPRRGEVRAYVASTTQFTLAFWLMDPMDREDPGDSVVLGQPVLTSDDEVVTAQLDLTMRVVRENVEHLMKLLRPGSGVVTRRDVSDAIERELLAKVLALDIHQHTAAELRGNRELFRGIYDSVNIELASTIRFYGLQLDNFTVNWGLTSEERERIRERRHEEELREIRRRGEVRQQQHEEQLRELERVQEIEDLANRGKGSEQGHDDRLGGDRETEARTPSAPSAQLVERPGASELVAAVVEKVKSLVFAGADVNARGEDGWTPLHLAAFQGRTKKVKSLVFAGADVNARSEYDRTPLHLAAHEGRVEVVRALVDIGVDVNVRADGDQTPLHLAAHEGRVEVVRALVDIGADVNARQAGRMPLHLAALQGHIKVVRALVDIGVDVNARAKYDWTPLHFAVSQGHIKVVRALVDIGVDVNARAEYGDTALHRAAWKGHTGIVRTLVDAGADVNARDERDHTPLWLAGLDYHTAVMSVLRRAGAEEE